MSCPEDVYRRIPSGAAIQQRPAGEPAQQSADGPSPHYFPAAERRRRGPPADPRAAPPPPPASQPGPGREAPAAGYRPPPRARPSQPPPPQPQPLLFPKTNPMVTPGEAKRYQASSYELPERAAPKRDPREDRPRTCPPERTVSGREQLRAVPPAGRPAPPDRIGPPDRLGPPERHGAPAAERSAAEVAASAAGAGVDPRPPGYPTQLGPRLSDDRLLSGSPRELLARYRHAEAEIARLMMEHGQQLRELNRQLQAQLRDLCCFLDDDRQKGRKLAREWQRFGRYTASVMRQEVSAYQTKLRQLDAKQQELVKDNLELKVRPA
ncbi:Coiled-coil domain-containing protein 85C [Amphibalanus amphitrite]|uniref:Coiled-coil domain-containing protein 85C n=1 Tax=Amphibalanus amphitrite TaxID=1232801 RepID=A0A6A4VSV9_AMPAM|nr:Coiled-coil domain-containing protein 85C [Amphibalanus amphitrite]